MLASLYLIVLLLTLYVPFLGLLIVWFLPLPFIIYVIRHSIKPGILLWFVALMVTFIVGGPTLLPLTFLFGSGGIVVGELYRRKKPGLAILLGGALTYISNLILFFVISILVFDIHPIVMLQEMMRQSIETAELALGQMGQEASQQLEAYYQFIDQMNMLAPLFFIFVGTSYALFIQLICGVVLKRLRFEIPMLPPFREWRFPKSFLWYYLIVLIVMLIGVQEGTTLFIALVNLFSILEFIMVIQGLSFIFYFCYIKGISRAIPIIAIIIIFIFPGGLHLVRILGIIDLGFDLRSRLKGNK